MVDHTFGSCWILSTLKMTGLRPSVQQDTEVPFSFIQGKFPPYINAVTTLYRSFHAQWQNPSGMSPPSPTMNSWPSSNTLQASIDWPIGGLSPKICLVSVFFNTVIFNLFLSTIKSPTLHFHADILALACSPSTPSSLVIHLTLPAAEEGAT